MHVGGNLHKYRITMIRHLTLLLATLMTVCLSSRAAISDTLLIESKHLATPMKVTVVVPEASKTDASLRFPTVYLLNGYSGDYRSWGNLRPDMADLADRYGMVIVMPDGRDSWYWDSRPGMMMESFFTQDLVPTIDHKLPTITDASKRAISGLSMGGHGALWLAIRHSDIWGSAASMSGGVDIRPFPNNWKMKQHIGEQDKNPQAWEDHTVINLVPQLKPGQLNILFDCGVDDFFAEVNNNLHQALLDAKIPHDYISRPGAHTGKYWANSVLYHLLFFNEIFTR